MIKIALVCANYLPNQLGGAMISTDALATRLSRSSSVDVVCGSSDADRHQSPYRIIQLTSLPYLSFHPESANNEKRHAAAVLFERYFNQCSQYLVEHPYSVIDAQGPWCETASIVTVRFVYPAYLDVLADNGYSVHHDDPWTSKLLEFERRTYKSSSVKHFIAVSTKAKVELEKYYDISGDSITVINNGVDTSRFGPSIVLKHRRKMRMKLNVTDQDLIVTYCGNNFIRKNLPVFLEVVRPFYPKGIKLVLMAKENPTSTIITNEDRKHIVYFDMTMFPEKILAASDILLFPTIYDTCAKIVLESMAMGLPVIVSESSGLTDIIENGRNGFTVSSPADVVRFRQLLEKLIEHEEVRRDIGTCASKSVVSSFSWHKVTTEVLTTYKRVLQFA